MMVDINADWSCPLHMMVISRQCPATSLQTHLHQCSSEQERESTTLDSDENMPFNLNPEEVANSKGQLGLQMKTVN
jgi:hypothetical protein